MSRKSDFNSRVAERICEELIKGRSLASICEGEGFPDCSTVYRWVLREEGFRAQYAQARILQADALFDQALDIADDGRNDWMKAKRGKEDVYVVDREVLARSKLRIEARRWMVARLNPQKYGERREPNAEGSGKTDEESVESIVNAIRNREGDEDED